MTRAARAVALGVLLLVAAVALRLPDTEFRQPRPAARHPTPTASATPPSVSQRETDRQDRVGAAHRRRETRAFDERPLLAALPIRLGGVGIAIEGLAPDGVTTELRVSAGPRGRVYAEALYGRALAAFGDTGGAYEVRWTP